MADIVDRLRDRRIEGREALRREAADRIERLRKENAALRAGLKAHWGDKLDARLAYVLEQTAPESTVWRVRSGRFYKSVPC